MTFPAIRAKRSFAVWRGECRFGSVEISTAISGCCAKMRRKRKPCSATFWISVTDFFRDAQAFTTLASEVMPKLFDGRGSEDTLRVWVPACTTGEEVYSLAMLMLEQRSSGLTASPKMQIFPTDIDDRALHVARAGRYPAQLLKNVSPERKARFFLKEGASYVVTKEVRDLCIFSSHNVINDPPFSKMDLVSCRNLLIYFGLARAQALSVGMRSHSRSGDECRKIRLTLQRYWASRGGLVAAGLDYRVEVGGN